MPIVVSTHFDDAVFSCYSVLGPETTVVTVLGGVPPAGVLGDWDADGGATSSRERVLERRAEDERALALSGSTVVHLDFPDKQYWDDLGEPSTAELADGLLPYLVGTVYVPAGIGNDQHALVRDAVLSVRSDVVLYADLPYALRHGFGNGRDVVLDEAAVAEKLAASRCYVTQLTQLVDYFGDFLTADAIGRERFTDP